jgi:hypothetical protein
MSGWNAPIADPPKDDALRPRPLDGLARDRAQRLKSTERLTNDPAERSANGRKLSRILSTIGAMEMENDDSCDVAHNRIVR